MQRLGDIITYLYCGLFFLVPLILWPYTSEVFEFNKMVTVYIFTTIISALWLLRNITAKKFIFRRTILDIPLILFLFSQIISTLLSIDPLTSLFGYYSRFNGGLISTICYLLLYWAFVSNINQKHALITVHCSLITAVLVSLYGILEHFGIDKNVWVQDVQSRVFSTLGQPNWLAAYLVALIPLTFTQMQNDKKLNAKFFIYLGLAIIFFITLLFTKSRSGLLGFIIANLIYWILTFVKNRKDFWKPFFIYNLSFAFLALIIGTQFTPNLFSLINQSTIKPLNQPIGPALESGGTESGEIRKIVWSGALEIWKNYPIFGTGAETFAYSYAKFKPLEQNMVSEWDFIYNKAHNEFLNMAANTGTFGLLTYLSLICFSIIQIIKSKRFDLFSGLVGLHITNFFGFSVVPTQLQLFLFPAIGLVLSTQYEVQSENKKQTNTTQKFFIFCVLSTVYFVLFAVGKYWYSDYLYNMGKNYNSAGYPSNGKHYLEKAINLSTSQGIYHNELAISYALLSKEDKNFLNLASSETQLASRYSPNINIIRTQFGIYIRLSEIDPNFLTKAKETLDKAIELSPNDPKLIYNLGLMYARSGQNEEAIKILNKAIELKPNYPDPQKALEILLGEKSP